MRIRPRAPIAALGALTAAAAVVIPAAAASAHSLDSSTISVHVDEAGNVDATISVALETLDQALGTTYTADVIGTGAPSSADAVNAYLADHLAMTDTSRTELTETFSGASVESVEGITSYSIDVTFGASDPRRTASTSLRSSSPTTP